MSFIATGIIGGTATAASVTAGAAVVGAGAGLYGALSGGGGGFSPTSAIAMTPGGKQLEKSLYGSLKTDLFPANIASKFLGDAKKMTQTRKRISSRVVTSAATTGPDNVVSGNVAKGLLAETSMRFGQAPTGQRNVYQSKRAFSLERLNKLQNFINLQSGSTILQAQADLLKPEMAQASGAATGAGIGSIAQLLAAGHVLQQK